MALTTAIDTVAVPRTRANPLVRLFNNKMFLSLPA